MKNFIFKNFVKFTTIMMACYCFFNLCLFTGEMPKTRFKILNNHAGNRFEMELLFLIAFLGVFWLLVLMYNDLFDAEFTEWPIKVAYLYHVCQRIIFHYLFLYFFCSICLYSWIAFRVTFTAYFLLELILYICVVFDFKDLFWAIYQEGGIIQWYFNMPAPYDIEFSFYLFQTEMYYGFYAVFLVAAAVSLLNSFWKLLSRQLLAVKSFKDFSGVTKKINQYDNFYKKALYYAAKCWRSSRYEDGYLLLLCFTVWMFTFGNFINVAEKTFHGPYFFFKVVVTALKIITLSGFIPLLFLWALIFSSIFFWAKDIDSLEKIKIFFSEMKIYYTTPYDSKQGVWIGRNFFFCFLCLSVFPALMIFDISLISIAFGTYRILFDQFHFFLTIFMFVCVFQIFLAAIFPGDGIKEKDLNVKQFCKWIFYLSVAISLFFINHVVAYLPGWSWGTSGLKGFIAPKAFKHFSRVTDVSWKNIIDAPLSSFLPENNLGIFTFGYDYFSLILCLATALIFSFVFLTSMFSATLTKKRYFFFNLIITEFCILGAFLNLNLFGFFVFFESSLFPMFVIIGLWGSSDKRWFAAKQMLFYSLTASTPMIVCLVYLYDKFGSLDYVFLNSVLPLMSYNEKFFIWISLFLMFATKIPLFPFHSWLLNAHVEAPTSGSIILAAILLKLGVFGIVRYLFQFLYEISVQMSVLVVSLALIGVLYSSVCAMTELDLKKILAYTSISHMNLAVIGLFTFEDKGFLGALYLSIGHVVTSAALFFLVGSLYDRFHTRNLLLFGGLTQLMPVFSTFLFFFVMANSGFPWSLSFVGEFLLLTAVARKFSILVYAILIVASVALLYANLRIFIFVCFGTVNNKLISNVVNDLTFLELYCAALLTFNAFILMWNCNFFFFGLIFDYLARLVL